MKFTSADGTQDFLSKTKAVIIGAGHVKATISTTVNADTATESDETYSVVIDRATATSGGRCSTSSARDPDVLIARNTSKVTIFDNTAPTPSISIADASVVETSSIKMPAKNVLGLSAPLSTDECVWYHTVSGSASGVTKLTANLGTQDFRHKSSFVKIAAGKTTGAIGTSVNYDTDAEFNEAYDIVVDKLTLTSGSRCVPTAAPDPSVSIGRGLGTVTIVNDDPFTGVNLSNRDLRDQDLAGFDLAGARLAARA